MRNTVAFSIPSVHWPEESDAEPFSDVLLTKHTTWFLDILRRIEWLKIDPKLCQEDWGVVAFASHEKLAFWIGLSVGDVEDEWIAHVHHGSFSMVQRFTRAGKQAFEKVIVDFDRALRESGATTVRWYHEDDQSFKNPAASPTSP
jgi:hypothetical protein